MSRRDLPQIQLTARVTKTWECASQYFGLVITHWSFYHFRNTACILSGSQARAHPEIILLDFGVTITSRPTHWIAWICTNKEARTEDFPYSSNSKLTRFTALTLRRLMLYIYMEHPFLMFLDHTQRRSTVGRTPLDEWSARRRDLYLTTHDTHNRQISMPPVGFKPTISAGERPQAARLLRSVLRRCVWSRNIKNRCSMYIWH